MDTVRPEKGSGSSAEGPVFWEVCIGGAWSWPSIPKLAS